MILSHARDYRRQYRHQRMKFFSLRHRLLVVRYLLGMTGLLICCVTSQVFAVDVTLSWDDPNNTPADVGGYNLYYGPTGQTLTAVDVGNSKMHTLTGLDAGQSYDFAVTAYDTNHGRESVLSDKVTFTTPTAPPPTSPPPTTPPPASPPPVAGDPFLQDGGSNGLVVMEAEQFHNNTSQGGHSWISITRSGASGSGAMQATPNNGTTQDSNYVTSSPRLDFQVQFVRTGTHYVWLRGLAPSRRDDTVHVGLDGQAVSSSDRITSFSSTWRWSKTTLDRSVATIQVPTTGVHTVNVWMREDGLIVDKLVLTTNSRYTPSGTGPSGTATMAVASSSVVSPTAALSGGEQKIAFATNTTSTSTPAPSSMEIPAHIDADNDGFADALEIYYGLDPSDAISMPLLTDLLAKGQVSVDHNWQRVNLSPPFLDPVVIAKPARVDQNAAGVVRLRDISSTGFDIRIEVQEDPNATSASVDYLVMERGAFLFVDAAGQFMRIEATTFAADPTMMTSVTFQQSFNTTPVVLTTIASGNNPDPLAGQLSHISPTGFVLRFQDQESTPDRQTAETIAYLACEPISGTVDGLSINVNTTSDVVNNAFPRFKFAMTPDDTPVTLAERQGEQAPTRATDPAAEVMGYLTIQ